jgi:putative two-component system response regulator
MPDVALVARERGSDMRSPAPAGGPRERASMTNRLNILILEDSDDDRFLVERCLDKAGIEHSTTWVVSRADFVRALESDAPDLILADYHLPDFDALGALELVMRLRPEVPVIVVTGGLSDERAATLLQSGAHDYVLKDRLARLGPAVLAALERVKAQARRAEDARRLKEVLLGTIATLARIVEARDPYTAGHQSRVSGLAVAIGRGMGMPEGQVEGMGLGAALHDIGKICVPAEILSRPGKLSRAEFEIIKTHPQVGYDIVKGVSFPWPVDEMILQHHERLDGSGYPRGLKGDEIILEARIIAVADVVESMTSHRPYRPGLGLDSALDEITSKRGTHFDAQAVDACVRVVRRDPSLCCGAPERKAA